MRQDLALSLRRAAREPASFARLYSARSEQLLVFFVRRTFDVETARDLTAETFAQAFQHRRRFRGRTDAEADAWLYGIARHQLSRYARKGVSEKKAVAKLGIRLPTVSEDDHDRILEIAGLDQIRDRVTAAFADLSTRDRDVLRLRVIDERPYPEVAEALGVSEQAARARVSRALRQLADAFDVRVASEVAP
jgi:RNA polymerase sigma factor (sigma-70 family)